VRDFDATRQFLTGRGLKTELMWPDGLGVPAHESLGARLVFQEVR
jgi:hypothetical protein